MRKSPSGGEEAIRANRVHLYVYLILFVTSILVALSAWQGARANPAEKVGNPADSSLTSPPPLDGSGVKKIRGIHTVRMKSEVRRRARENVSRSQDARLVRWSKARGEQRNLYALASGGAVSASPEIQPILDRTIPVGRPYQGPKPLVRGASPIRWSLNAAPVGMRIDHVSGVVHWSRPKLGSTLVQIKASNEAGSDLETWMLTVSSGAIAPEITPLRDQAIQEGVPYTSPSLEVSGTAPVKWSLGNGPAGMQINPSTGKVSWAKPVPGTHVISVRASNRAGKDIEAWVLTVNEGKKARN